MPAEIKCSMCSQPLWVWLTCALIAVGGGVWAWAQYFQTYHLEAVQKGVLYRGGNRGLREFQTAVRRLAPKTVVCLIDDRELADPEKPQFQQEIDYLNQQGIKVERIAVKLGGWPNSDDVRRFLDVVAQPQNRPVLVHCAQGVRRTGMFVAAYQKSVMGWDDPKVKEAMLTFGHSRRTVKDIERFIEIYDAKDRKVTRELEMSQE